MALVIVPDNQLSLAIGKEGQNARLARLTGWKVDIRERNPGREAREEIEALLEEERELQAQAKAELELKRPLSLRLKKGIAGSFEEEPEEEIHVGEEEEEEEFTPDDYIPKK